MTSLSDDLRSALDARGNALRRLLLYNVAVFVVIVVVRAVLHLAGHDAAYAWARDWLTLPANGWTLLTRPWTLLTYAFVHEDVFHLLFNMLNLYYFGSLIQEFLGQRRLVSLYVLGALAGALAFLLAANFIPALHSRLALGTLRGASGGVTAVVVGAATLLPDYSFRLLLLGSVRIKWIALALVVLAVAGLSGGNVGGEFAHLGGALLGFGFIRALRAGNDLGRPLVAVGEWVSGWFQPRAQMRVSHRQATTAAASRPAGAPRAATSGRAVPQQEEVDLILEKISRSGYDSLSREEKQQLFRASQEPT